MKIKLVSVLIIILLSICLYFQKNTIERLNNDLDRTEYNMSQLESENYSLTFKKGELEDFINQKNTQFKRDIDSVCNQYDIKIKDLTKVINTKTETIVKDTVFVTGETVYVKDDSLHILRFKNENNCISASIIAHTTDPLTKVLFEELKSNNESFSMVHREKKKWWQLFKKRKLLMTTVDNCGTTSVKELEIK